jgi:hypothetical protein
MKCDAHQCQVGIRMDMSGGTKMIDGAMIRPLTELEDLELRSERLAELIRLQLVSPTLADQLRKAMVQLDEQIAIMKAAAQQRLAA